MKNTVVTTQVVEDTETHTNELLVTLVKDLLTIIMEQNKIYFIKNVENNNFLLFDSPET
jgi:hypothetical protein